MKILKLRLKNLNSLAGEWSFDFSHPAFEQGGLLVITGPTGAGKTTILDAVCLALYGATPRLGRLTEADNELMSRGRAECSAELTFETPAGRYRCHWSQHRARKKADGKLQAPRHEIVDDDSGRVLESYLSRTQAEVERVTGMSFGQFSRSVMLAQGSFAAFLEAPAEERAALLERLTGTEIYGRISEMVHQRRGAEAQKLEALRGELDDLPQSEEDEAALVAESADLAARLAELGRAAEEQGQALNWRKEMTELEAAAARLTAEGAELARAWAEFQPHKARLDLALKALSLAGEHGGLTELRRRRDRAEADLDRRRRELPAAEASEARAGAEAAEAEARLAEARAAEEGARPQLIKARALDVEIREQARQMSPAANKLSGLMIEIKKLSRGKWPPSAEDLDRNQGWPEEMKAALAKLRAELDQGCRRLADLLAGRDLSLWREDLLTLSRRANLLEKLAEDLGQAEKNQRNLSEVKRALDQRAADLAAAGSGLRLAGEKVAALELDAERLSTIWQLQQKIRSFDEHRAELAEGQPCPLCGALEHPFARSGGLPGEAAKSADLEDNKVKLAAARRRVNALTAKESALKRDLKNARDQAAQLGGESVRLAERLQAGFADLGLAAVPEEPGKVIESLSLENRTGLATVELVSREAERLEKELAALEERLQAGRQLLENAERLRKDAIRVWVELGELSRREALLRRERAAVLDGRDPDEEERRLRAALAAAQAHLESKKTERTAAEKAKAMLAASMAGTAAELAELSGQVKIRSENFLGLAQAAGFADEAAWLAAAMPERERGELESRLQGLSSSRAGQEARLKENRTRLAEVAARALSPLGGPELAAALEKLAADSRALLARQGVVEQKLADLRRSAEARARLRLAAEAQGRECRRWDHLHKLIGSADGRKYRSFAQGLTFEILMGQANRQLAALSDRYLLRSDPARPLELSVMDNYQAGEIRSTKNLSGGESFLVSLALALGLARMASRRVRVDTLFLDEGFGSLDEETLDQALETLASLRSEGKLIGVISHIQALTDRIPARILVRPDRGPFSRVSGPGVEAVSGLDF